MIAIIELLHHSFSHECFNAGTVYQIAFAHSGKQIVYCAEEEQIKCVSRLLPQTSNISYYVVGELKQIGEIRKKKELEKKYSYILSEIIERFLPSTIVFTSAHCVKGMDVSDLVKKRKDINFILFQHGELEQLLNPKLIKIYKLYNESLYYKIIYIYLSMIDYFHQLRTLKERRNEREQYKNYLDKLCKCENASVIVFSNEYQKHKGEIPDKLIAKLKKIYLPYVYDWDIKHKSFDGEVKIGILPKTAEAPDAVVWQIVDYVNRNVKKCLKPFRFYMYREPDRGIRNVYTYESPGYEREYINQFMIDCDWLLIPYPEQKYILSCSGAMFDSINMELPVMMYASPCFNDFDDTIGIREFSVEKLGEAIIQAINEFCEDDKKEYVRKMRSLKEMMNQSNIDFFKREIK